MTGVELAQQLLDVDPAARVALMSGFSGTGRLLRCGRWGWSTCWSNR